MLGLVLRSSKNFCKNYRSDTGEALSNKLRPMSASLIICLLGLFLMGMYGSSGVKASEKEVTFEKVREKTYDAFIRDIAFGSVVKDDEEQIYCKVIVLENKEVLFFDDSGEIVSRKSLVVTRPEEVGKYSGKTAILSSRGNFAATREYTYKYGDTMNQLVDEEYVVYNEKGEEIYRIKGPQEGTGGEDGVLISDKEGSAVGTRLEYGALDFYSPEGGVKTVPLFGELGWWHGGPGHAAFSRDGEYLAVLIQYVGKRPEPHSYDADEVWIMLFDRSGNELWRRKVDERRLGNMAISEKGEYLFLKAFTIKRALPKRGEPPPKKGERGKLTGVTLSLYDKQGNELSFKDTSLFIFGSFCLSPQADYVALGGRNLIRLMRTEDGSIVFEKELPSDVGIRRLLFSGDGQYLIVGGNVPIGTEEVPERGGAIRTVYGTRVSVISIEGELAWQSDFSPRVRGIFSENGFLAFSFPYRYEIFKKTEKER